MLVKTKQNSNKILKLLFIALGIISLALGIVGVFLPLLPTTPFLLLSTALFMKSSKKLYNWLINHKYLGKIIQDYLFHKAIPKKTKIYALVLLWFTITLTIIMIIDKIIFKILLLTIAIAVTWHILSIKTKKE